MKIRLRKYEGNTFLQLIGFAAVTVRAFCMWVLFYIILRNGNWPWEAWGAYHIGIIASFVAWVTLSVLDANGNGPEAVA